MANDHFDVLVIGAGTAGLSMAARLRKKGVDRIGILDPAEYHYYQPLWTLVGGGCASAAETRRRMGGLIPKGVEWVQAAATDIEPHSGVVSTMEGRTFSYGHLVVAPGIQLDWDAVPGMQEAMGTPFVSSNYEFELALKTWERIATMTSGTAIFTMPSGPIKCAGAPQKIAYLAADYFRQQGVLADIRMVLVLPTPGMFGVPVFARELERVAARYGIEVRFNSEVKEIDGVGRAATVVDNDSGNCESITYDFMHVVPPQSAPDWIKESPLAAPDNPGGYVDVDKHTMQHVRHANVFSLGDAGSTPNSKTGAAVRKQAPVAAVNLIDSMNGRAPSASYDGYASCPLTTARNKMLLAEFDYTMEPAPTFPVIDTTKERRDMWLLKRYGLPAMYWNLMIKGLA